MTARRVLLLGPPGAGKGTQAARLAAELRVPHVSTGDMFRQAVASGTALGRELKAIMDRGDLVSDATVIEIAGERLAREDARDGFVLDGFPRTAAQAVALDALLDRVGGKLERCVSLVVDEANIVERLLKRAELEGRSDDNQETIRKRMRVYREQTAPLEAYYRDSGILVEVDGIGTIPRVAAAIRGAIA